MGDRYAIEGRVGGGATGTTYKAVQTALDRVVAIKELSPGLAGDPVFLEGFREEARLMAFIDHPNVVKIYDFIEAGGGAYLVEEYVDGTSLRVVMVESGRLTAEQSLGVLKGALNGLGQAHRLNLIHRDIKPENVLVDQEGVSKLCDFGLAFVGAGPGAAGGIPSGTPAYISPEAVSGATVDSRSDIYSAAVMLFELLTGRLPFTADNPAAMMRKHRLEPIPDPRSVNPELPPAVSEMVMRGMAKDPAARQPTTEAFLDELGVAAVAGYGEDWEERSNLRKRRKPVAGFWFDNTQEGGAAGTGAATVGGGSMVGNAFRQRLLIAAIGVAALLLLAGGGYSYSQGLFGLGSGSVAGTGPGAASPAPQVPPPSATPTSAVLPSPTAEISPSPSQSSSPSPGAGPPHTTTPGRPGQPGVPGVPGTDPTTIVVPNGISVSRARVYFQDCVGGCGFIQDGSPYYSAATGYLPGNPFGCNQRTSPLSVMEQYNFDYPAQAAAPIPITVQWNINWAFGGTDKLSFVSQVLAPGSTGTHDASTSAAQRHPPVNTFTTGNGSAGYSLSWTDPDGTPRTLTSDQRFYWTCTSSGA